MPNISSRTLNPQPRRRKRSTHKAKSVATTEEILLNRVLKTVFVLAAVGVAAYMTMIASRR